MDESSAERTQEGRAIDRRGSQRVRSVRIATTLVTVMSAWRTSTRASWPDLTYFRDRLRIPFAYQVVLEGTRAFVEDGVRCLPASQFLGALV